MRGFQGQKKKEEEEEEESCLHLVGRKERRRMWELSLTNFWGTKQKESSFAAGK